MALWPCGAEKLTLCCFAGSAGGGHGVGGWGDINIHIDINMNIHIELYIDYYTVLVVY